MHLRIAHYTALSFSVQPYLAQKNIFIVLCKQIRVKVLLDEQDKIKQNLISLLGKHTSGYAKIDDQHSYEVKYSAPSKRVVDKEKMRVAYLSLNW